MHPAVSGITRCSPLRNNGARAQPGDGTSGTHHALGQSVWEHMRDHPDDNAAFNRGLAEIRKDEQAAIAAANDWAGVTSGADVGAGAGALLASIVAGNPGVRAILFDRPDVLPDADHLLAGRGVRERCELVGRGFFEPMQVKKSRETSGLGVRQIRGWKLRRFFFGLII